MRQAVRGGTLMLPRVQRIRRGDRVLCYHRPTGIRLPDLPESHPEFVAAWAKAEASRKDHAPPVKAGTLEHVVRTLKASKRWLALSPVYRREVGRNLDGIVTAYGSAPAAGIRPKHIEADMAKLDPNPANLRLKAWRMVMAQAKAMGAIETDLSAMVAKIAVSTPGHTPWTEDDVARYRDHWPVGTIQRAAMELLAWTGARVSDGCRISIGNIGSDGVLSFRQAKTGGMAYVPWTAPLPAWARAWDDERTAMRTAVATVSGFTLLQTSFGKARTAKGLSNVISDAAAAAGILGKSAHGLRKYRLTRIAEAGGSAHAIMAWGGHASLSEAERYTRTAARKALIVGTEQDQNVVNAASSGSKRPK
ncbi:tyrosine-type recombinase/integrase [Xinfangfangia pollutisoli]|uniref:tyrosine-type recombinase/integrase n=1 Tax=Xinfangfangia pollutisoli TaxID=2865960 RepID=UPI001CD770A7|nr:tyrosine-type recombinase/integrase [Xinfangfangia pollutisoli]